MKKNDLLELEITDINSFGYGVGHTKEGKAVFVGNAVPLERIVAKVIKDGGSYYVAKAEKILQPSPYRIESPCSCFPKCGGCSFCHLDGQYELQKKRDLVKGFFLKAGLPDVEILPVLSAKSRWGYRNKVQYPYQNGVLGYYRAHSHTVVKNDGCLLHKPEMEAVLKTVAAFLKEEQVPGYDEEKGTGLLRHVYLRSNGDGSEMILTLVINGKTAFFAEKLSALIQNKHPQVVGMYLNVNREKSNVILGKEFKLLWGKESLTDRLLDCTFEISPASFYQVNRDGAELLYSEVIKRAEVTSNDRVVDLFCGIGTIGICLAKKKKIRELYGMEVIPEAVENARKNALRNGVENAFFCTADANRPTLKETDTVIVDPPRKGLAPELIKHIADVSVKKVVYVSCDPATLARDLALFRGYGYRIHPVQPVDMFPGTGHVETVVLMSRVEK